MRLFPKIFLTLISVWLLSFCGCQVSRFVPAGINEVHGIQPPVKDGIEKISYKTHISDLKKDYSGLMVIKKMKEGEWI